MRRRLIALSAIVIGAAALLMSCTLSDDPAGPGDVDDGIDQVVGPLGGEFRIKDGVTIRIPPGSLNRNVRFSVTENNSPAQPTRDLDFASAAYTVEPSGTEFLTAANISIKFDAPTHRGADRVEIVICCDEGDGWVELETEVDVEGGWASADIDHLSDFAAMLRTANQD